MPCECCEENAEGEFKACASCSTTAKCEDKGECSLYSAENESVCPPGEEMVEGECKKISVAMEIQITGAYTRVEATTGDTIIEITGIAFHSGMNKNSWELTEEGARNVARQMQGADLTLNHPDADDGGIGFDRNMDGTVEKAVVGYITSATYLPLIGGGYEVRYIANVTRPELFEALESGLWLRKDYGVSIGGSGVPIKADEDGIVFGEDFTFDHLAIVHRPAYEKASIETVERIEKPEEIKATLISHSRPAEDNQEVVSAMTDENTTTEENDYEAQIESLKADLVLSTSRVAEFEAADEARIEEDRQELVEKATEMGMSGHDDLQAETITTLIASWESAHPDPEPVVMEPVDEIPTEATPAVASEEAPKAVVANYLNGVMVESDEELYARCWNAWAKAYNGTLSIDERNDFAAPMYEKIKEMI